MKDSLLILSHFIKNPKEVGSLAPSSKFLTRKIVTKIDFKKSKNIVELGPGLGTFTKAILNNAGTSTRVFCFEINKKFCRYISKNITDKRLVIINAGADKVRNNLKKFRIQEADCIVSGLPFKNFSDAKKRKILNEVRNCLRENGKFILFQYTNGISKLLESNFSRVNRSFVPLNLPPAFVYSCEK